MTMDNVNFSVGWHIYIDIQDEEKNRKNFYIFYGKTHLISMIAIKTNHL